MKLCLKCNITKDIIEFSLRKGKSYSYCKSCKKEQDGKDYLIRKLGSKENFTKNKSSLICWQKEKRDNTENEDRLLGFPFDLKARDFILNNEKFSSEHRKFIERYEWLGNTGFNVKWVFTARHEGKLAGVVLMAEPNTYQFEKEYEAIIQRGACSSWAPKNLNSMLVMFSCRWMIKNTTKRIFVAYSDPMAGEIGTIYQACNFDYLGNTFGTRENYKLQTGKKVTGKYFTRTASMKKWAKSLGIIWQKTWLKSNGFQNRNAIPLDIRKKLDDYAKMEKKKAIKSKAEPKGKYVLLLKAHKREAIEKKWTGKPYPKRK